MFKRHAISHSLVDIIVVSEPLTKYCNVVTICLLFIKMLMGLLKACDKCQRDGGISRKQELLAVVFAFEISQSYLLGTRVRVHTNHSTL